jgi:hypothetical protein
VAQAGNGSCDTVGGDPNAWFEKELERRAKEDPEFQAKYPALKAAQPVPPQNGAPPSVVKLPPSLNRQPGTAGAAQAGSLSNEDLYRFATS